MTSSGTLIISSAVESSDGAAINLSGTTGVTIDAPVTTTGGVIDISTQSGDVIIDDPVTTSAATITVSDAGGDVNVGGSGAVTSGGGNILVAATGAVSLNGPVASNGGTPGGTIAVSADGGDVTVGADVTSGGGDIVLTASGAVAINDAVESTGGSGGGAIGFTAGSTVTVGANVTSDTGPISIKGVDVSIDDPVTTVASGSEAIGISAQGGSVGIDAPVTSAGGISVVASTGVTTRAPVDSALGSISLLTATGNIGIGGNVTSEGSITISNGSGSDTLSDPVESAGGGSIAVSATNGSVAVDEPVDSNGGAVTVTASDGVNIVATFAPISAGSGALQITAIDGLATIQSDLKGSNVAVTGGGVDLSGQVQSSGTTTIVAGSSGIDLSNASIDSGSAVTMTSVGSATLSDSSVSVPSGGVAMTTEGPIALSNNTAVTSLSGSVAMTSGCGTPSAGCAVPGLVSGNIEIKSNSPVTGAEGVTLNAGGTVTVEESSPLAAPIGSVKVIAQGGQASVESLSTLTAGQAVSVSGAPVDIADSNVSGDSVTITSSGTSAGGIATGSQVTATGDDLDGFEEIVVTGEGGDMASCADPAVGASTVTSDDMAFAIGQPVQIAAAANGSEACSLSYSDSQPVVVLSTITNVPTTALYGGSFVASVASVVSVAAGTTSVVSSNTSVCSVGSDGLTVDYVGVGECVLTPQVQATPSEPPVQGTQVGFAVSPAPTTLVAVPVSVVGSLLLFSVTFSGTLTSQVTGKGISGQKMTFTDGPLATCSASTNANGVATCTVSVLGVVALLLGPFYSATYGGGTDYLASSTTGKVTLF
jgi:hypothetical protein